MTDLTVEIEGIDCVLTPEGGLLWPDRSVLFVADLHLGKPAHFRRAGLSVPEGSDTSTLTKLGGLCDRVEAKEVVILGDIWHSSSASRGAARDQLRAWICNRPGLKCSMVLGNHDRGSQIVEEAVQLEEGSRFGPFLICHKPPAESEDITLCGHVHPVVKVPGIGGGTLRCFWHENRVMVLPAFGEFTGGYRVNRGDGRIYLASETQVFALP